VEYGDLRDALRDDRALLPLPGDRAAIVNDTNFGSTGRARACPTTAPIVVSVPGLRR
jgi:hypothetical protein